MVRTSAMKMASPDGQSVRHQGDAAGGAERVPTKPVVERTDECDQTRECASCDGYGRRRRLSRQGDQRTSRVQGEEEVDD